MFFFFFHPFNRELILSSSDGLFLLLLFNLLISNIKIGKKIKASIKAVIAANKYGSMIEGLETAITGCIPIKNTAINPQIIPFFKL